MSSTPPIVAVVFGTRPEAIKMAPVVAALRRTPRLRTLVCLTGQHRQMVDQVLDSFALKPDVDLNVMQPGQTLAGLTARVLTQLDAFLLEHQPHLLLVQGDTTTALASALTAFYRQIPVGHVEAGLRTGQLMSPWPEEGNRQLITRLAALHFCPTADAEQNLLRENVPKERIFCVGNPIVDVLMNMIRQVESDPPVLPGLAEDGRRLVLITGHRRENFGGSFEAICRAIAELARRFPDVRFVYPVHLNPNVREPVNRILEPRQFSNVRLVDPLPYREFIALFRRAVLVLSDSGGVQEEAPTLGTPVLLMRETTERPEAVAVGAVKLVGARYESIVSESTRLLTDEAHRQTMIATTNPFGDGQAAPRIASACAEFLSRAAS